jgi:SAM-dependent methyltransferase
MKKEAYYVRAGRLDPGLVARYWRLVAPAETVLDVGCGQGCFGRLKPDARAEVFGVDIDPIAVDAAAAYETAACIDLEAGTLPFDDAAFDAAFAKDVLEHLTKPWTLLAEIKRVLRPGGRLVVSVPMEFPRLVWSDYTHVRGYTEEAVANMLDDCGFRVEHVQPMGGVPMFGRLGWVDLIPTTLRLPGMRRLFGRSWEALAVRR